MRYLPSMICPASSIGSESPSIQTDELPDPSASVAFELSDNVSFGGTGTETQTRIASAAMAYRSFIASQPRASRVLLCGALLSAGFISAPSFAVSDTERAGARAAANQ